MIKSCYNLYMHSTSDLSALTLHEVAKAVEWLGYLNVVPVGIGYGAVTASQVADGDIHATTGLGRIAAIGMQASLLDTIRRGDPLTPESATQLIGALGMKQVGDAMQSAYDLLIRLTDSTDLAGNIAELVFIPTTAELLADRVSHGLERLRGAADLATLIR
jgi:hypothetical protein